MLYSNSPNRQQQQQPQSSSSSSSPGAVRCEEFITVVIPNTVWQELEYRSKASELEETAKYKARKATQLLVEELHWEKQQQQQQRQQSRNKTTRSIIRCQSRAESNVATRRYLEGLRHNDSNNTMSNNNNNNNYNNTNNDDRILACALMEKDNTFRHDPPAAASSFRSTINSSMYTTNMPHQVHVILITSDKVLTGKLYAETAGDDDSVAVYTPNGFLHYYTKRMQSFQSRNN